MGPTPNGKSLIFFVFLLSTAISQRVTWIAFAILAMFLLELHVHYIVLLPQITGILSTELEVGPIMVSHISCV